MAEIITATRSNRKKYVKKNIRVDLTPMVDLGFFLITFFIVTTTMQEQKEMKLLLPKDSPIKTLVEQSTTLTFILKRSDSIGYYEGFAKEIKNLKFGSMRNIIQQKQMSLVIINADQIKTVAGVYLKIQMFLYQKGIKIKLQLSVFSICQKKITS